LYGSTGDGGALEEDSESGRHHPMLHPQIFGGAEGSFGPRSKD
jgi:hypothetical protein